MTSMVGESILHITNLVKSFGKKKVIDGVSFSLSSGENLVLLGKSGIGEIGDREMHR